MKKIISVVCFLFNLMLFAQDKDALSLLFIGDFMGHKDQIKAAYDKKTGTYNYDNAFVYMKKTFGTTDVSIGNLEVTLGTKPYSGYPQFSSPKAYATAIKKAGVSVLVTSNNHSCDKGKKGIERTIKTLDSLKIKHTGTFISLEEKEKTTPLIIRKKGFKIALINYTYGTNGLKPTSPNIVNYLDKKTIKDDVEKAKKEKVDAIIAFVHWGLEYKNLPSAEQKKWFWYFKSLGINIVIGAHPHVVQPMLWDKKEKTFVAYSLGNFVSHQRTFPRDGGAVLKLVLAKKDNSVVISKANYKLTWVYETIEDKKKQYYVIPVSEFENFPEFFEKKKIYDKMMRFVKHARTLFAKENKNVIEYK